MIETPDKKQCTCWYCDGELEIVEDLRGPDFIEGDPSIIIQCKDCGAEVWVYEHDELDENGEPYEFEYDKDAEDAPYDRNRCPLCGGYAIWGNDFDYEDVFGEGAGEGIVSYLSCTRCNCMLEYSLKDEEAEIRDSNGQEKATEEA